MQVNRAQEILRSNDTIMVELNGVSVWIDSVDPQKETAKVHMENNPADTKLVSVQELEEVH